LVKNAAWAGGITAMRVRSGVFATRLGIRHRQVRSQPARDRNRCGSRFSARDAPSRPSTTDEFLALRTRRGFALATQNFAISQSDAGARVVSTETRVYATDAPAIRGVLAQHLSGQRAHPPHVATRGKIEGRSSMIQFAIFQVGRHALAHAREFIVPRFTFGEGES
jgi:hypothetical protein